MYTNKTETPQTRRLDLIARVALRMMARQEAAEAPDQVDTRAPIAVGDFDALGAL